MKSIDQGHRNFWFCDLLTFLGMLGIFLCHLTRVLTGFHVIDYQTFPTDFLYGLECFVILFFLISGFKIAASVSFDFKQGAFFLSPLSFKTFSWSLAIDDVGYPFLFDLPLLFATSRMAIVNGLRLFRTRFASQWL